MGKIVFWLVVFFGVLFVLRLINIAKSKGRAGGGGKRARPPATMVRCVECGVFLPEAEARPVRGGFHCAQADCAHERTARR